MYSLHSNLHKTLSFISKCHACPTPAQTMCPNITWELPFVEFLPYCFSLFKFGSKTMTNLKLVSQGMYTQELSYSSWLKMPQLPPKQFHQRTADISDSLTAWLLTVTVSFIKTPFPPTPHCALKTAWPPASASLQQSDSQLLHKLMTQVKDNKRRCANLFFCVQHFVISWLSFDCLLITNIYIDVQAAV